VKQVEVVPWLRYVLGNDADLALLQGSEERIRNAYREYLRGYQIDKCKLRTIVVDNYSGRGFVSQKNIQFYSFCAHHFLPFFGTIDISYEPASKLIGIGKLPRIVEAFTRRFSLQELVVKDIGGFIVEALEPKMVKVTSSARHLCVESRGPSAVGSFTESEYYWSYSDRDETD